MVLTNGFTLAPVPGAIHAVGARPVLVEIDEDLRLDLDDLAAKAARIARPLPGLAHARTSVRHGPPHRHLWRGDMPLIEDCAHTMGARWNGKRCGYFGLAGVFNPDLQAYELGRRRITRVG